MSNINTSKTPKWKDPLFDTTNKKNTRKKHLFLTLASLLAITFWLLDSTLHYFWYNLDFEIIPTDAEELWMRTTILILLICFGLFADSTSKKIVEITNQNVISESIYRAKKQWELVVDALPQLVIAINDKAEITRVNRTIESWGMGEVNRVDGLHISKFLKFFNKKYTDEDWSPEWIYIWQQIQNRNFLTWETEKIQNGKTYQFTLKKFQEYDATKDQCYAVLIIDDITTRQDVENSLKKHALNLEKIVNERTIELKQTNKQLEHELHVQKIAKEELKKSQECRQDLLHDLFSAQETERKRIAQELHDSIGQSLGAAKFRIEELLMNKQSFSDDDEYSQFDNLVGAIKGAIDEVRHIAMDLRPAMLDDLGTLSTLKWFCREFENTYSKIKVDLLLNIDESDITNDKKVIIFRIVQEAMNNIAKHANATKIDLELSKSSTDLRLRIDDNGRGFVYMSPLESKNINTSCGTNQIRCSFGLSSMRERAESTKGEFEIESTPDSGTSVMVTWKNQDTTI